MVVAGMSPAGAGEVLRDPLRGVRLVPGSWTLPASTIAACCRTGGGIGSAAGAGAGAAGRGAGGIRGGRVAGSALDMPILVPAVTSILLAW